MKQTKLMMGMPISLEIVDNNVKFSHFQEIFNYFQYIDDTFST